MMDPDPVFTGKIEEREVALNATDGEKAELEYDDFKTVISVRRIEDNGKEYGRQIISAHVTTTSSFKLGLAIHLKYADFNDHGHECGFLFHSMSTCRLVFPNVPCDIEIVEIENYMIVKGTRMDIRVKTFWLPHQPIYPTVVDKKVVVVRVENQEMEINCKPLSLCSEFFSAYFSSAMKESQDGKYPIMDCTIADFAELLAVIDPYASRKIDDGNVATMLDLARQFIMPTVTHKCECFLIERMNRKEAMMENIELAEQFGLHFARELFLACFGDTVKFRELMTEERFDTLPEKIKHRITVLYVEVDLKNNRKVEKEKEGNT